MKIAVGFLTPARRICHYSEGFGTFLSLIVNHMNPDPLDDLLSRYSQQPAPVVPNRLKADIWQTIEQRRSSSWSFGALWRDLWHRPRLVLSALAVALLIGALPAASIHLADQETQLVRKSLRLDVFSPDNSSVLMASIRPLGR